MIGLSSIYKNIAMKFKRNLKWIYKRKLQLQWSLVLFR